MVALGFRPRPRTDVSDVLIQRATVLDLVPDHGQDHGHEEGRDLAGAHDPDRRAGIDTLKDPRVDHLVQDHPRQVRVLEVLALARHPVLGLRLVLAHGPARHLARAAADQASIRDHDLRRQMMKLRKSEERLASCQSTLQRTKSEKQFARIKLSLLSEKLGLVKRRNCLKCSMIHCDLTVNATAVDRLVASAV